MDLAGGAWIFLAFLILAIIVTAYAYYTVKGSGIGQRGWSDRDQVMGMTVGKDPSADIRTWQRGTGGPKRPRRMTPAENKTAADRKSTRLNSSHANISYAVFCLKKKKK